MNENKTEAMKLVGLKFQPTTAADSYKPPTLPG
jgi:hypothetical protein